MSLIRCMIVDDEDLTIQSLEQYFGKHTDRFELVGKAYSGKEAVKLALELKPDIILTDIVMPGMDGIEMIETLKDRLPSTIFIILTAYSDFEYAKQAIRMNVKDYIVKVPLSERDIFQAMERAESTLCEIETKEAQFRKLNKSRLENMHRFRRQIFSELLQAKIQPNQLPRFSDDLNVNPMLDDYCCLVIEQNDFNKFKQLYTQGEQSLFRYGMLNVAEETIGNMAQGFVCEIKDNQMIGIVSWPTVPSYAKYDRQCVELGRELIANIHKYMKQKVNVGFSHMYKGWTTVPAAYRQAIEILQDVYYFGGEGHVFTTANYRSDKQINEVQVREWFGEMSLKLIPEVKTDDFQADFKRIALFARDNRIPKDKMSILISEFIENVKQKVHVWKGSTPPAPILLADSIKFNEQWEMMKVYVEACLTHRHSSLNPEIIKAKQYIEVHITEKITLEIISDFVNLTPPYFSSLFKRVENENFVDYVNRRKIERAVAFLKEKDYSNLQLSELVGIQNERYFCTLFKHYYGFPPQKFRKKFL